MITETRTETRRAWSVTLTGDDRKEVSKRAEEIHTATEDMMVAYCSAPRATGHEIQMEFLKGGEA